MSRSETLKLIAFFAGLIAIIFLVVFCGVLDIHERSTVPDPSLSRLGIPEKDGLTIVSHGMEITAENDTAVIELIELFVQENYDDWSAMGYIQVREAAQRGVAIEIHYNPTRELICLDYYDLRIRNTTVLIDQIYVTIPDMPDKRNQLYYYVSPVRDGDMDHTILLPIETANELLELIGEEHVPSWIQFLDKIRY